MSAVNSHLKASTRRLLQSWRRNMSPRPGACWQRPSDGCYRAKLEQRLSLREPLDTRRALTHDTSLSPSLGEECRSAWRAPLLPGTRTDKGPKSPAEGIPSPAGTQPQAELGPLTATSDCSRCARRATWGASRTNPGEATLKSLSSWLPGPGDPSPAPPQQGGDRGWGMGGRTAPPGMGDD
jgi:hypothetical protein